MSKQILKPTFLLALFFLTATLSPTQFAQTTSGPERPGDLIFRVVPPTKKIVVAPTTIPIDSLPPRVRSAAAEKQREAQMEANAATRSTLRFKIYMKNLGNSAVKSIVGQLLIIFDDREAARLPFTSNKNVDVNDEALLAKIDLRKLPESVRSRFLSELEYGYATARVRVERVEYKNGRVWQHP